MRSLRTLAIAALFGLAAPALADDNQLTNGALDGSGATSFTNGCCNYYGGGSAASGWLVWNNTVNSTTTTEMLASTDPFAGGGGQMLHMTTTGEQNGLYQQQGFFTFAAVDVYVASGTAWLGIATNNGNLGLASAFSTGTGWQRLIVELGQDGNGNQIYGNQVVLYSAPQTAGGDFLFDNAYAGNTAPLVPVPEPGEWAMMAAGLGVVGLVGRRRLRKAA